MENRHDSAAKPTGIPRLSKLPVPKSPSLRTSQSRENFGSTTELRNPRLRPVASRDQLSTGVHSRKQGTGDSARQSALAYTQTRPSPVLTSKPSPRDLSHSTPKATPARNTFGVRGSNPSREPVQSLEWEAPTASEETRASAFNIISQATSTIGDVGAKQSKARPSLSERTIETLSQIPSSPALTKKSSAFYDPSSTRKQRSRPGSRESCSGFNNVSDGSNEQQSRNSRPGSSSGPDGSSFGFRSSMNSTKLDTIEGTPSRIKPFAQLTTTPSNRAMHGAPFARSGKAGEPESAFTGSDTPSQANPAKATPSGKYGARTMTARTPKSRPSLNGLFKKPSMPALPKPTSEDSPRKASLTSQRSSNASAEETQPSTVSTTSTAPTVDSIDSGFGTPSRKSSAALREQIARAKAARRAASQNGSSSVSAIQVEEVPVVPSDSSFDFGLSADPFNQQSDEKSRIKMLMGRIESARTSGRLNIAALSLREIPSEVLKMYDLEAVGTHDGTWAESIDLTRFVAADNELEMIDDAVFPDTDPEEFANDPDSRGSIFGGLETLDLHGNMLIQLPMGLRRLTQLTSLNLSQNRLANNCLEVLSQIGSLRDLKLGGNLLYGPLDPSLASLESLEILDLHGNNITSLPVNLNRLSRLRILNISENSIETLPFIILASLPITELVARKNQLSGTLIEDEVGRLQHLQVLDVSSNQLTAITAAEKTVQMPKLHQLCVSLNRLQALPDVSSWSELSTLVADENSISAVPEGMTALHRLRHVDFSSNDIRVVPSEIGRMENLAMIRLSGNPLREKKFSNLDTDELKAILADRLEPLPAEPEANDEVASTVMPSKALSEAENPAANQNEAVAENHDRDSRSDMDDFATPPTSAPVSPARSRSHTLNDQAWQVKPVGVLDRSGTESSSLHPVICSKIANEETIREIHLHHNLFTVLPESLSFFAATLSTVSLSHNQLVGETYFGSDDLSLPALKELNLASNHITSLLPLTSRLQAPKLQKVDVSFNRISSLPQGVVLQTVFPCLSVFLISNNHLDELNPEAIKGLRIVDAANNDIAHLNPRIGLLGGSGGLERLNVMGNRFRVPRWNVLERGTEATLRWLRGRVPVAEMTAWKDGDGEGGEQAAETSLADLD